MEVHAWRRRQIWCSSRWGNGLKMSRKLLFSLDGLGWIPRDRGVTIADFEVTLSQLELHFVRESTLRPPWIDYLNREVQRFCSDGARESVISMRWSDRKWFRFLFAFLSSTKRTWTFKLMETHDAAWTPLSLQVCSGVDNNFEFTWLPDWSWKKKNFQVDSKFIRPVLEKRGIRIVLNSCAPREYSWFSCLKSLSRDMLPFQMQGIQWAWQTTFRWVQNLRYRRVVSPAICKLVNRIRRRKTWWKEYSIFQLLNPTMNRGWQRTRMGSGNVLSVFSLLNDGQHFSLRKGRSWRSSQRRKIPQLVNFHGNDFEKWVIWDRWDAGWRGAERQLFGFSNSPQCLSHHPSSTEWRDSGPLLLRTSPRVNCFRFQGSCISPSGSFSKSGLKTWSTFAIGTSENNVVPFKSIPKVRHSQKCFQTLYLVSMRYIPQWTLVLTPAIWLTGLLSTHGD